MAESLKQGTGLRGFAAMDESKQRAIASKGGQAAHRLGTAHEFSAEEAREAGRKGGQTVSRDRAHMAQIGRQGGEARAHNRAKNANQAAGDSKAKAADTDSSMRSGSRHGGYSAAASP